MGKQKTQNRLERQPSQNTIPATPEQITQILLLIEKAQVLGRDINRPYSSLIGVLLAQWTSVAMAKNFISLSVPILQYFQLDEYKTSSDRSVAVLGTSFIAILSYVYFLRNCVDSAFNKVKPSGMFQAAIPADEKSITINELSAKQAQHLISELQRHILKASQSKDRIISLSRKGWLASVGFAMVTLGRYKQLKTLYRALGGTAAMSLASDVRDWWNKRKRKARDARVLETLNDLMPCDVFWQRYDKVGDTDIASYYVLNLTRYRYNVSSTADECFSIRRNDFLIDLTFIIQRVGIKIIACSDDKMILTYPDNFYPSMADFASAKALLINRLKIREFYINNKNHFLICCNALTQNNFTASWSDQLMEEGTDLQMQFSCILGLTQDQLTELVTRLNQATPTMNLNWHSRRGRLIIEIEPGVTVDSFDQDNCKAIFSEVFRATRPAEPQCTQTTDDTHTQESAVVNQTPQIGWIAYISSKVFWQRKPVQQPTEDVSKLITTASWLNGHLTANMAEVVPVRKSINVFFYLDEESILGQMLNQGIDESIAADLLARFKHFGTKRGSHKPGDYGLANIEGAAIRCLELDGEYITGISFNKEVRISEDARVFCACIPGDDGTTATLYVGCLFSKHGLHKKSGLNILHGESPVPIITPSRRQLVPR